MPLPAKRWLPGDQPHGMVGRLEEEIAQLHQAVDSHAVIDQAIGVLIAVHQIPPENGWEVLREVSQHLNIKIHAIANEVVEWALGQPMTERVLKELDAAVQRWKRDRSVSPRQAQDDRPFGTTAETAGGQGDRDSRD